MSLVEFAQKLGMELPGDEALNGWDESLASFNEKELDFLDGGYIRTQCETLGMNPKVTQALVEGTALFQDVPDLKKYAWHCRRMLFLNPSGGRDVVKGWKQLTETIHPSVPLFYVYVLLSGTEQLIQHQQSLGIPHEITIDTLSDLELWIKHEYDTKGAWGFAQMGWLSLHFTSGIFKLGRLQFNFSTYWYPYDVYRNIHDGRVVVFAGREMKFRRDGQVDGANGIMDEYAWPAIYEETDDTLHGTPICPLGKAMPEPVTIKKSEWKRVLTERDSTLGTHIPATGPMTHEDCGESFCKAVEFFGEYFPEYQVTAFTCSSWLLDNQFCDWLKPDSNIVKFLKEWYLIPNLHASDHSTLDRIFGTPVIDLDNAPQDTSLRRAIIAHMKAGGRWRSTGALIFSEDLNWGKQVYRSGKALVS